ncbi:MAG: C45 family autoproteolytic acyltransferase/hydrolase [Urechidicola sp.]|nr:C45 family autoproteolytic acyltransferase/hydrolase [Urechidicola sp.]
MSFLKPKYHFISFLLILSLLTSCGVKKAQNDIPDVSNYELSKSPLKVINDSLSFKGNNSIRHNKYGQWELVTSGNPYDMGNSIGILSQNLIVKQEELFFQKVEELVPSKFKQNAIKKFLAFYNRKMYLHIKEEYKAEIFGISKYSSDKYDLMGSKYQKSLYLHGAHDIGHALQDLALVGCSSFAVWGENTVDGDLIIARNFDFYAGDEFAREKMISFINPDKGYKFMAVSWAGMIGVMSGMNDQGLTVTINAGKSDIPLVAKTPISLVTREILQYASTIDEAIAIAKMKEVFVSESILIGSAKDNKAVLIEMSPDNFDVYNAQNTAKIICSNHFQSEGYQSDENNSNHILESHSKYRYDRMEELLDETEKVTPQKAVDILRNKEGLNDELIGYGNEKALNQLLAHHGIVFQPSKLRVWVSTNPYQLGEFVAFNLDEVFENQNQKVNTLSNADYLIEKDSFVNSDEFHNYEKYRKEKVRLVEKTEEGVVYNSKDIATFKSYNPHNWEVYFLVGEYYYEQKQYTAALVEFEKALTKEITTVPDRKRVEQYIKKIKRKIR